MTTKLGNKDYFMLVILVLIVSFCGYLILKNFLPKKNDEAVSFGILNAAIQRNKEINKVNLSSLQESKFHDMSIGRHNMKSINELIVGNSDPFVE